MKSKVLNRKMFSAIRHDAHGVGITSGLTRRPTYASGGRVGRFQGGGFGGEEFFPEEEVVTEDVATTSLADPLGVYQLQAKEIYPIKTEEEILGKIRGMRGDTRQQDWFDLARFFSKLPGEGGVGENVARAIGEVLPDVQKRKQGDRDKMIEDQLAYEQYKLGQETKRGKFIADRIASAEDGTPAGTTTADQIKYLARHPAIREEYASSYNTDPDKVTDTQLQEFAKLKVDSLAKVTNTERQQFWSWYGLGTPPSWISQIIKRKGDLDALQKGERSPTPDKNKLIAAHEQLDIIRELVGNKVFTPEMYEDVASKITIELLTPSEATDRSGIISFGSDVKDPAASFRSLSNIQRYSDEQLQYIMNALNKPLIKSHFHVGMRLALPNGEVLEYRGVDDINNPIWIRPSEE
jgi:hypothetical protein